MKKIEVLTSVSLGQFEELLQDRLNDGWKMIGFAFDSPSGYPTAVLEKDFPDPEPTTCDHRNTTEKKVRVSICSDCGEELERID